MAHVDAAGGIGEHLQAVELGAGGVFGHAEGLLLSPRPLPFHLDLLGIVMLFRHAANLTHWPEAGKKRGRTVPVKFDS